MDRAADARDCARTGRPRARRPRPGALPRNRPRGVRHAGGRRGTADERRRGLSVGASSPPFRSATGSSMRRSRDPAASILSLVLSALLFAALAISGCGSEAERPPTPGFRVALLTPGPVSDAGWNASAFEGLQLIKARLGAQTAMVQTNSPADFEDAFRDFGSRGFNLIFANGFEYTDAAIQAGRDFPHTVFVVSSGSRSSTNVASLSFALEQATYIEGVLAAAMSKTGVAGAIGGIELPAIKLTFDGFRMGFRSVRPAGRVLVSYTGNFEDVGAAKEAALAQISRGADFLIHNADA